MIKGCEHIQKLKTIIWSFPPFMLKYINNVHKVYKGKINYKKTPRMFKNNKYFSFCKLFLKKYQLQEIHKVEVGTVVCQM
jgi:hypothetical protein